MQLDVRMFKLATKRHKVFVLNVWVITYVQVRKPAPVHFQCFAEVLETALAHLVARNQQLEKLAGRSEAPCDTC